MEEEEPLRSLLGLLLVTVDLRPRPKEPWICGLGMKDETVQSSNLVLCPLKHDVNGFIREADADADADADAIFPLFLFLSLSLTPRLYQTKN